MSSGHILRNLKEKITHWVVASDGRGGRSYTVQPTIRGRWEDKQVLFRDPSGEEVMSEAVVYLASDVTVGDYVYLGVSTATNPVSASLGARPVRQFSKIPNTQGTQFERKAFL